MEPSMESSKTPRGAKATYNCSRCGSPFVARTADRKRGWARFCSRSCKAAKQEQRTGQYAAYINQAEGEPTFSNAHLFSNEE